MTRWKRIAGGVGQLVNRLVVAGQETPGLVRILVLHRGIVGVAAALRQLRLFGFVKADRDHLVVVAGLELDAGEHPGQVALQEMADIGAAVIDRSDDGRFGHQLGQAHRLALFVAEHQVERDESTKLFIKTDLVGSRCGGDGMNMLGRLLHCAGMAFMVHRCRFVVLVLGDSCRSGKVCQQQA